MKYYKKLIRFVQSLRTGLLAVVCLLCIAGLLAGCGAEDKLLSELRKESESAADSPENAGRTDEKADEEVLDAGENKTGSGPGAGEKSGQSAGTDDRVGQGAGIGTDDSAKGQSAGGRDVQGAMQNTGSGGDQAAETIYVHVCGAVVRPGVYEMPEGSRFYEAVDAAGGFAEDACEDYLNMAALLADGSRLEIPTRKEIQERKEAEDKSGISGGGSKETEYSYYTVPEAPAAETGNTGTSAEGLVNINTADITGLCALPGIGEGRAKAIIEYREKQGGFQKKEDIMQVSGIGEKMYARMEDYLTVE